jgi:ABC-2 type transport system ATP-binding protein
MILLETKNLTKIYHPRKNKTITAVNKLNLTVKKGEIFGILGPNGSGKTTCLKLLMGITFATTGQIRIMGKTQYDINIKKDIGFLPENPYYYDYLTGQELLYFYGRIFSIPAVQLNEKIDRLLEITGLAEVKNITLKNYSKGMLERIGLSASLINDPKILILDEPTTGLDPIGCRETRNLLVKLKKQGKTILLSSHFLSEVERICDRIAILHNGSLLTTGSLKTLFALFKTDNLEDLFIKAVGKNNITA